MRRRLLLGLAACGLLLANASAEPVIIGERDGKDIVTVRGVETTQSKQALSIFPGISGKTAGAKGLSLLKVVIPPGGSAKPHVHKGFEFGHLSHPRPGRDALWRGTEEERGERGRRLHLRSARRAAPARQSQRHGTGDRHRGAQRSRGAGARDPTPRRIGAEGINRPPLSLPGLTGQSSNPGVRNISKDSGYWIPACARMTKTPPRNLEARKPRPG